MSVIRNRLLYVNDYQVIDVKNGVVSAHEGDGEPEVKVPDDRLRVVLLDHQFGFQVLSFVDRP
jgi:hypothetical protein